jgi:hypothetical protein
MVVAVDSRFLQDQLLVRYDELSAGLVNLPPGLRELVGQRAKLVLGALHLLFALYLVECAQLGKLRT